MSAHVVPSSTGSSVPAITIDRIACDGYGLCAEILPEMIRLDDWGYPILDSARIPEDLLGLAKKAAAACPVLALKLVAAQNVPIRRP